MQELVLFNSKNVSLQVQVWASSRQEMTQNVNMKQVMLSDVHLFQLNLHRETQPETKRS